MRTWPAALLLLTAGAGEARAQTADDIFCSTLRRLLDAASEQPAFQSLGRIGPLQAAGDLGFDTCRVVPDLYGNRLVCTRIANAHVATGPRPEARIQSCVPGALRMSEPPGSPFTRFRIGVLAFHVERRPRFDRFTLFAMPVER